jgi:hypothetical protein
MIVLSVLATVFFDSPNAIAQSSNRNLDGYGFISGYYDNNVFSYSDQDRQRFEAGDSAGGKYSFESLGDYVTTLALRGDYQWNVRKHSMWRARLLYDGSYYARNTERTNHRVGMSLQRLLRHSEITLDASHTPNYYLRHLYWRPMPERPAGVRYAPAVYDRFAIGADGRTRLARAVDGVVAVGFTYRDYEFPFDERDNNAYSLGSGVDVAIHPRLDTSIRLVVDVTRADGADASDPAIEDISNNRYGVQLRGAWRMSRSVRFVQAFDYGHQVYTTSNVADIAHHDRRDDEFESTSELGMVALDGWQPQIFFQYRASTSTTPPGIAEFGQYTAVRYGLQITYYF